MNQCAIAAMAYSLYDAENTTRLSEDTIEAQKDYFRRAETLLEMMQRYRPKRQRVAMARAIRK